MPSTPDAANVDELRGYLEEIRKLASDPFVSEVVALRACLLAANEALGFPPPESSPERDIARAIIKETVTKPADLPITEERPRDVGAPGAAT